MGQFQGDFVLFPFFSQNEQRFAPFENKMGKFWGKYKTLPKCYHDIPSVYYVHITVFIVFILKEEIDLLPPIQIQLGYL